MKILKNISLKPYNSFGVESLAEELIEFNFKNEIIDFFKSRLNRRKILILGGGSNVLFINNYRGIIVRYLGSEISIVKEDERNVWIKGEAGLEWHQFVISSIDMGYQGLENLSLIPGTLGAAPIQNIGAYGVEIKDFIESVQAVDISSGEIIQFNSNECEFDYRDSIFKKKLKGKFAILNVTLKLNKVPKFNVTYKDIQQKLKEKKIQNLNSKTISDIVIEIRKNKLPDPEILGNAGSFFKNPFVSQEELNLFKARFPDLPSYPYKNNINKVSAAWLIDQCGWKGIIKSNVGIYKNQPLVIINYGMASGKEIYEIALEIQASVLNKFGIKLEPEINII